MIRVLAPSPVEQVKRSDPRHKDRIAVTKSRRSVGFPRFTTSARRDLRANSSTVRAVARTYGMPRDFRRAATGRTSSRPRSTSSTAVSGRSLLIKSTAPATVPTGPTTLNPAASRASWISRAIRYWSSTINTERICSGSPLEGARPRERPAAPVPTSFSTDCSLARPGTCASVLGAQITSPLSDEIAVYDASEAHSGVSGEPLGRYRNNNPVIEHRVITKVPASQDMRFSAVVGQFFERSETKLCQCQGHRAAKGCQPGSATPFPQDEPHRPGQMCIGGPTASILMSRAREFRGALDLLSRTAASLGRKRLYAFGQSESIAAGLSEARERLRPGAKLPKKSPALAGQELTFGKGRLGGVGQSPSGTPLTRHVRKCSRGGRHNYKPNLIEITLRQNSCSDRAAAPSQEIVESWLPLRVQAARGIVFGWASLLKRNSKWLNATCAVERLSSSSSAYSSSASPTQVCRRSRLSIFWKSSRAFKRSTWRISRGSPSRSRAAYPSPPQGELA
jgi:hypothetical protein